MIDVSKPLSFKIRNMAIVCALFVVIIHCRPGFAENTCGWWARQLLENGITQIAVPFFFTVSGFMLVGHLAFAEKDGIFCTFTWYCHEIRKRVRTLLIPFLIWNSLWLFMCLPYRLSADVQDGFTGFLFPTWADFGLSPFDCPALIPLWYIRAIFILILFSPTLIALLRLFGWPVLIVIFVIYGVCCPYVPMTRWTILQSLTRCGFLPVQGFFYFSLGIALRLGIVKDWGRWMPTWPFFVVGMGLATAQAWFDAEYWSCYLGFFSLPFLLYGVWSTIPSRPWPALLVGSAFPIYLLHRFVQFNLQIVFGMKCSICWYAVFTIVPLVVSICVGTVLKRCCPRLAAIAFGGR